MTVIQPGKVPTYSPSPAVTMTGYDDSDRTRFLFNGSQFVKAKLVIARPSFAYVGYVNYLFEDTIAYKSYLDINGKQALVNGERYVPQATGVPASGYGSFVLVGFPVQVTTSSIVLWSTSHLSFYGNLKVYYTYDNPDDVETPFYFEATVSSVSESYDSLEARYAGESPPSGLYKYTIALDSSYTARYFKISANQFCTAQSAINYGDTSITVDSTSVFPSTWLSGEGLCFYDKYILKHNVTYTGKSGSSFTGVAGIPALGAGDPCAVAGTYVILNPSFAEYLTEVELVSTYEPVLEIWNTNGTQASSQDLDYDNYYDITYDNAKGIYYTIRFNEDLNGTAGASFLLGDNFNSADPDFDSVRWTESTVSANFQHNVTSGTLDYVVSTYPGEIITNYYIDGDFSSTISLGFNRITSPNARTYMGAIDYSTNNVFVQMGMHGQWEYNGTKTACWEALHIVKTTDTTGGVAQVRNLRLDTRYVPVGNEYYTFTYNASTSIWTVVSGTSGGSLPDLDPGESYSWGPLSLSLVHSSTPVHGAQIVLGVNTQNYSVPSSGQWWWDFGIERSGNNYFCKYDIGGGFINWITYTDTNDFGSKFVLFSDGANGTVDISMDDFTVSGSGQEVFPDIYVFSIEAVDSDGDVVVVPGFTDASGYVIKKFDVINDTSGYNSFIGGRVQITTDSSNSGFIYIKVGTDLYKYSKTSMPLDLEDGTSASLYKQSVIPETDAVSFSYNNYSKAGLCYVEYDEVREGTYLKTISTSTVSGTEYEALLDVTTSNYPFAWDVNNFTTLYFVDGTSLKFYDMDEGDVAFCNVVSNEKIMSAGTSATSSVVASVLNIYGEPLSAKTVAFTVSAGAGAVSPASDCTNASGIAETTYTVGATVGITTITATASDASC